MIPVPTSIDPAPPPPQPPSSSFGCDRHPQEQFSSFCPACLCERLATLDDSSSVPSSSSRRPSTSTAAAALKSLFSSSSKPSSSVAAAAAIPKPSNPTSFPELRRTKSFSASKQEAFGLNFSGTFEPQRKSCDVRGRSTLWTLFSLDDNKSKTNSYSYSTSYANVHPSASIDINNSSCVTGPVVESEEIISVAQEREDFNLEVEGRVNSSTIKELIDLDSQSIKPSTGGGKDLREMGGRNFWSAASVFSKKWQKWRQRQKLEKQRNGKNPATLPVEKSICRETQSEVPDYGFGRRSCDTDSRFLLDAGRISFDYPRYSFEEPRASWDGYLVGRSFPKQNPMVCVVEDGPIARCDHQIPVEEEPPGFVDHEHDEGVPGGSAQTKEYYTDSSCRRRKSLDGTSSARKSLDRTSSVRKSAATANIDEMKDLSNTNTLLAEVDYLHGFKVLERDRETVSNSRRTDDVETFKLAGGFHDNDSIAGKTDELKVAKKSRRWSWNIWGFIYRRSGGNANLDGDRLCRSNRMERSFSESWHYGGRWEGSNVEARSMFNGKALRNNSSVSWRQPSTHTGLLFGDVGKLGVNVNGYRKKQRVEFILKRNSSARYSRKQFDATLSLNANEK